MKKHIFIFKYIKDYLGSNSMKYIEVLLILQLGGIHLAYTESTELFNCSKLKLLGRLFIIFTPILLYINLLYLGEFR
jgi:hypothetical protein